MMIGRRWLRDGFEAAGSAIMPRYYFNLEDGKRLLDDEGLDLPDLDAARKEALRASNELLRAGPKGDFWNGSYWRMWVTDEPNGEGRTIFTLRFSAET
jgi:Domain of unknown function (DUF6894)